MATAVQVQYRRGTSAQVAAFAGAAGEMVVDSTNNRLVAQDGVTAGGWPAAKLSEIAGGFANKFRNGAMDVWQRGTSPSLSLGTSGSGYSADGWIVGFSASSAAAPSIGQAGGRLLTKNSLQITGASNLTDVYVKQRIESLIAAALCSQTVTVQAQVYNNTGGAITPALTVKHPPTQDGWGGTLTTDVNAANLQSCANGAWTLVAYTFAANAACYNGLEVTFDFGSNFGASGQAIQITECDLRVTPGLNAGQFCPANMLPPPELRPVANELVLCQRYYQVIGYMQGAAYSSAGSSLGTAFPVTMRGSPTVALLTTTPTIVQFTVGAFTGSGAALVGGGTTASPSGVGVGISGFSGLTAGPLPVFSSTASLLSASAEL